MTEAMRATERLQQRESSTARQFHGRPSVDVMGWAGVGVWGGGGRGEIWAIWKDRESAKSEFARRARMTRDNERHQVRTPAEREERALVCGYKSAVCSYKCYRTLYLYVVIR